MSPPEHPGIAGLALVCPECGTSNTAGATFCAGCGKGLADMFETLTAVLEARSAPAYN